MYIYVIYVNVYRVTEKKEGKKRNTYETLCTIINHTTVSRISIKQEYCPFADTNRRNVHFADTTSQEKKQLFFFFVAFFLLIFGFLFFFFFFVRCNVVPIALLTH